VFAVGVALRCLIVDDNPLFLEGATALLEREGMEVVGVASNGADAVRLAKDLAPDVALVDVDLGDEDGFELARRLASRKNGRRNVILISTHPEADLAKLVRSSSALGFVGKNHLSAKAISDVLERAVGS
jgi:two-component system, NarL family, nitrate/nitrite response regulator NarL